MQIFIDYEKTLVLNKKTISHQTIEMLKSIAKNNEVYILSTSTLFDVIKAFDFENIHIVSTLENAVYFNNTISFAKINFKTINDLLKNPSIYTAYTIVNHETLIFKYQNRLKEFYPNQYLKLIDELTTDISFIVIAINIDGYDSLVKNLNNLSYEVLGRDYKRVLLKITKTPSTKLDWLLKYKKSPTIGIGDSLFDYEFIKHCDYDVAMLDGDEELIKLCKYKTELPCKENGALKFIINLLKHHSS